MEDKEAHPDAVLARELFLYCPETGLLFHKERHPSRFKASRRITPEHRSKIWNSNYAGKPVGNGNSTRRGYYAVHFKERTFDMHRIVWLVIYGVWAEQQIDHIDHDRTNNRIENLREVVRLVNGRNQTMPITNTSGKVGVRRSSSGGKWVAQIRMQGKTHWLGTFGTFDAASEARSAAERKFGFHPNHGKPREAINGL